MPLPIAGILGAGNLVSGLLGGGGPDAGKVAERTSRVNQLTTLAQQGNVDAWLYLGAIGRVQPAPKAISVPISQNGTVPQGWTSHDWGDAYQPIQSAAARAFAQLAPQFAQGGNTVAQTVVSSGGGVATQPIPDVFPMIGTTATAGQAWPWWVIAGLVVILALLFLK